MIDIDDDDDELFERWERSSTFRWISWDDFVAEVEGTEED